MAFQRKASLFTLSMRLESRRGLFRLKEDQAVATRPSRQGSGRAVSERVAPSTVILPSSAGFICWSRMVRGCVGGGVCFPASALHLEGSMSK